MQFILTTAGLAAATITGVNGPHVSLLTYKLGSGSAYSPTTAQTDLVGIVLHTGTINNYRIISTDTVEYVCIANDSIGDFSFGEIGLYDGSGNLVAIAALPAPQQKLRSIGPQIGNVIEIDCQIQLTNAAALFTFPIVSSSLANLGEINDLEILGSPQAAAANAFIVHNLDNCGNSGLVMRHSNSEWSFSTHNKLLDGVIDTGTSITTLASSALSKLKIPELGAFEPGKYILVITSGGHTGAMRFLDTRNGPTSVTFSPSFGGTLSVGDSFKIYKSNCSCCNDAGILWAGALEYNAFATRVNTVIGAPTGVYPTNFGYNQNLVPLIPIPQRPTLAEWTVLYDKLLQYLSHQNLNVYAAIDPAHGFFYKNENPIGSGLRSMMLDYELLDTSIGHLSTGNNSINPSTLSNIALANAIKTRTTGWINPVSHGVVLTFVDSNSMRGFFNTQSAINYNIAVTNTLDLDDADWQSLATAIGTITFGCYSTTTSGSGTGSSIGFYQLTNSVQQIFTHTIGINTLKLEARLIGTDSIEFVATMTGHNYAGVGAGPYSYSYSSTSISATTTSMFTARMVNSTYVNSPPMVAPIATAWSGNF